MLRSDCDDLYILNACVDSIADMNACSNYNIPDDEIEIYYLCVNEQKIVKRNFKFCQIVGGEMKMFDSLHFNKCIYHSARVFAVWEQQAIISNELVTQ